MSIITLPVTKSIHLLRLVKSTLKCSTVQKLNLKAYNKLNLYLNVSKILQIKANKSHIIYWFQIIENKSCFLEN